MIRRFTAFRLTKREEKILELVRSGLSHAEVAARIGVKNRDSIGQSTIVAAEKERILGIHDKRERGESSLSKARGEVRMVGTK